MTLIMIRLSFFIISIFQFLPLFSQTSKDYKNIGDTFFQKKDYKNALLSYTEAKVEFEKEKTDKTIGYGELLLSICKTKTLVNDFNNIMELLISAENIFLTDSLHTYFQRFEVLKIKLPYWVSIGDYINAEKLSNAFVYLAEKNRVLNTGEYYNLLTGLGISKFNVNKISEGEQLINQVILFLNKSISPESKEQLCGTIWILADLYRQSKNLKIAEENYLKSFELASKIYNKKGEKYLGHLTDLADFYSSQGLYSKALSLNIESNEIIKTEFSENSIQYANALQKEGNICIMLNELDSANIYIVKALSLKSKLIGENNQSFAYSLMYYGECLKRMRQLPDAEKILNRSLSIFNLSSDEFSTSSKRLILDRLGSLYEQTGEYEKAEQKLLESFKIISKIFKNDNPQVLFSIESLARFYNDIQNFDKADSLYRIALKLWRGSETPDSISLSIFLETYAKTLEDRGKYHEAEVLFVEGRNISVKVSGENSEEYLQQSLQLANLYNNFNPTESKKILNQLRNQYNNNFFFRVNNVQLLSFLFFDLGQLSLDEGDFPLAESYYKNALNISYDKFKNYPSYYADALVQLGGFYREIGSIEKAQQTYLEAYRIQKKTGDSYIVTLRFIALLYIDQEKYDEAKSLYMDCYNYSKNKKNSSLEFYLTLIDQAELEARTGNNVIADQKYLEGIGLMQKMGYTKTSSFLNSIERYANFCGTIGRYNEADSIYKITLNQYRTLNNNYKYAITLYNIAHTKGYTKNFHEADSLYDLSIGLLESTCSLDDPGLQIYYSSLAWFYLDYNSTKGLYYLNKGLNNFKKDVSRQFSYLSEKEKISYIANTNKMLFADLSNIYRDSYLGNSLSAYIYDKILLTKSIVLKSLKEFKKYILKSNNSDLKEDWAKYNILKKELLKYYTLPATSRSLDLRSKEEEVELIEKRLLTNSKVFSNYQSNFYVDWKKVQSELDNTKASIEFISFRYYSKRGWTDSVIYAALVLRPGYSQPKYIYLFEEQQLSSVLKNKEGTLDQTYINRLYQQREGNNPLYQLIWQPLDSLLQGVTTVYVAPSGMLHKISLGAIPSLDGSTVSSKYDLQIVGTTADIINKKEDFIDKNSVQQAIVFGGINYDIASSKPVDFTANSTDNIYAFVPTDSTRGTTGKWNYLGGSQKEAEEIAKQFIGQKIETHFYSDSTATETLFKNMPITGISVIHIATHGYFFPDIVRKKEDDMRLIDQEKQTAFRISENPLLRSGLIFAGANPAWTNPDYVSSSTDDGILTAYEISNMDLSNVKLVVLSACETGLGDIKGSEGVFGLQRSFKLAGVKNIIMSLWKVPDEKTQELMQMFYQFCFKGNSISEAFKSAQEEMRSKYPASPYYWAGFTLLQ